MNTIFMKSKRDLLLKKVQSLIIIGALALGVVGVGAILNVYTILKREMQKNYDMTNPPHFIINLDSNPIGIDTILQEISSDYDWEFRGIIEGRTRSGDGIWKPLILEVVPNFATRRIDRFFSVDDVKKQKNTTPASGEIFIEKAAIPVAKKGVGEQIDLLIPGTTENKLSITGIYHAPSLPPAWMENWVYGFISEETALMLTKNFRMNQILFRSNQRILTLDQAQQKALVVKDLLTRRGIGVTNVTVPVPGAHPHAGQMNSLLYILQVFGLIALLLAAALVGNIFGSLLARQKREIGVMKSLGASSGQILLINLIQICILSSIALVVAIPAGQLFAQKYSTFTATILNFKIYDSSVPWWGYAVQTLVGLGIPILSALLQMQSSLRLTVREVITDYGVRSTGKSRLFSRLKSIAGLTPMILSLRNAFRNRQRMVLLIISLSAGGILFIMAQNITRSISVTVDKLFTLYNFDASFTFSEISNETISNFFSGNTEIDKFEISSKWKGVFEGSETTIYAIPEEVTLLNVDVEPECAVITHTFANYHKKNIGDTVTVQTPAGQISRKISSIVTVFGTPSIYIAYESLSEKEKELFNPLVFVKYNETGSKIKSPAGHLQRLQNLFKGSNKNQKTELNISDLSSTIENALNTQRIMVTDSQNKKEQKDSMVAHMKLIASFLIMMSFLSLFVGALTIISSVSLSIIERRREIGVLRAFGTNGRTIIRLFLFENAFIGIIGFFVSVIAAVPLSNYAGTMFGLIFLKVPLSPAVSHHGIGAWLFISMSLTIVFSYLATARSSDCDLPKLLNYE